MADDKQKLDDAVRLLVVEELRKRDAERPSLANKLLIENPQAIIFNGSTGIDVTMLNAVMQEYVQRSGVRDKHPEMDNMNKEQIKDLLGDVRLYAMQANTGVRAALDAELPNEDLKKDYLPMFDSVAARNPGNGDLKSIVNLAHKRYEAKLAQNNNTLEGEIAMTNPEKPTLVEQGVEAVKDGAEAVVKKTKEVAGVVKEKTGEAVETIKNADLNNDDKKDLEQLGDAARSGAEATGSFLGGNKFALIGLIGAALIGSQFFGIVGVLAMAAIGAIAGGMMEDGKIKEVMGNLFHKKETPDPAATPTEGQTVKSEEEMRTQAQDALEKAKSQAADRNSHIIAGARQPWNLPPVASAGRSITPPR